VRFCPYLSGRFYAEQHSTRFPLVLPPLALRFYLVSTSLAKSRAIAVHIIVSSSRLVLGLFPVSTSISFLSLHPLLPCRRRSAYKLKPSQVFTPPTGHAGHGQCQLPWNYSKPGFSRNWGQPCSSNYTAFCGFDRLNSQTRINLYVTVFLAAAIPQNKYTNALLDDLYMNAVFYGLAILITVLIETIKRQLDLYHAVFAIHMLSCLTVLQFYGTNYVPMRICRMLIRNENIGLNRFLSAKRVDFKMKMALLVQLCEVSIILPPWLLYVWIQGPRFGAQPECNHLVKYVFFYVTIRATVHWLRILFLVGVSLGLFYALIKLRWIPSLLKALFAGSHEASDTEFVPTKFLSSSRIIRISSVMWVPSYRLSQG
jgi:hypothetical protein